MIIKNYYFKMEVLKKALLISTIFLCFQFDVIAQTTIGTQKATIGTRNLTFFVNRVKVKGTATFRNGQATAKQVNDEIERLSALGGGVIKFLSGTYTIGQIHLKSNIRIEVASNVTFKIDRSNGNSTLFNLGRITNKNQEQIFNIEIVGASDNPNSWFTIDLGNFNPLADATPFKVGYVKNFALSRFIIKDNYTLNPSVFLVADSRYLGKIDGRQTYDLETFGRIPMQGVIKNAKATKIGTGYALVQPFSGKRIYMENLKGNQGITVRLEPGSGKAKDDLNLTKSKKMGSIDDIYIKNISNELGFAALFIKPHAKICNNIYATGLSAKNSLSTVYIASASLTPLSRRGKFINTKFENISFTQTIENKVSGGTNPLKVENYPADSGLEGLRFMTELHRTKLVRVRNSMSPKPGAVSLVAKDAGGQRYKTHPIAPVIFTAKHSATSIGTTLGRYNVDLPSNSQIKVLGGVYTGAKVVYRNEAKVIINGTADTDYILK
ncbi:hypothetical protein [Flammeovirga kamogawensis]|uniref:Right-handed parallel beta-helix repeat-containing protein n=1 Tax=Flammeovirga kamogawensis TaxID=373891 RepID=A0ABX8H5A2_9BACT|nr:hypothetical protein [Flammeovirga kamogawensis]MBB6463151.1 hypothetical protein [Flammeovirga kamogawensis]QWG10385.1 hypothetical protein KM029_25760 [Flammeovirga kamogawensis]